jgi:hypothetical protein
MRSAREQAPAAYRDRSDLAERTAQPITKGLVS